MGDIFFGFIKNVAAFGVADNGVIYETKDGEKVTRDTEPLITPIIRVTVNKVPTDLTGSELMTLKEILRSA